MKKGNRKRIGIVISVVLSLCLIPLLLPSATQAACVPPPSGLISWWPGDGNATDIVGGANGILQGGATTAPGLVGQAFSLNGVSASVPTPLILPLVGTIECWVNLASLTQSSSILSIAGTFGTARGNDRLWISVYGPAGFAGIEQNTFVVNAGDRFVDAISVPYPWPVGVWKHIAVTFDYVSAVYQLYIDGAFQTSAAGQRTAPTGNFQIGAASSDFYPTFFSQA
jgi:hypothetical protein